MSDKNMPLEIRWNPEQPIEEYNNTGEFDTDPKILQEIHSLRQEFGSRLLVLGHHYQRDEVIQFADRTGDSLALSQFASQVTDADVVIFLGVHFMAETADMLTPANIPVILPDLRAGCTMADMAEIDDIENAWNEIAQVCSEKVIPITYVNSTAAVKAHVGKNGGTICTSSNADKVIKWGLEQGDKVMFFPDQHLGRNTSYALGIPLDKMILWDPELKLGGNSEEEIKQARVILWKGFCSVHQHFLPAHIDSWREKIKDINIIVHPECSFEVVQKSDFNGSTSHILKTVRQAEEGSKWAIGTENNLVVRLGREMQKNNKEVYSLAPYACLCSTMFRITPEAFLKSLQELKKGKFHHRITVDKEIQEASLLALDRMFKITG